MEISWRVYREKRAGNYQPL